MKSLVTDANILLGPDLRHNRAIALKLRVTITTINHAKCTARFFKCTISFSKKPSFLDRYATTTQTHSIYASTALLLLASMAKHANILEDIHFQTKQVIGH